MIKRTVLLTFALLFMGVILVSFSLSSNIVNSPKLSFIETPNYSNRINIKAVTIDSTISCLDAKTKWLSEDCDSYDECTYYSIVAKKCDLAIHNEKNPDNEQGMVIIIEESENGEQKILFGLLDLEEGIEIAAYSKAVLSLVTGNAFLEDPVTATVVDAIGEYGIDAYLEAAINNDELIIFYPNSIPTQKFAEDVFNELSNNKEIKKLTYEMKKIGKEGIEAMKENPEYFLNPGTSFSIELTKDGIETVEKVVDQAGKVIKENKETIVAPTVVAPAKDLKQIVKKPSSAPKVIRNRIRKVTGIKW